MTRCPRTVKMRSSMRSMGAANNLSFTPVLLGFYTV
jgi:hypothetical protein